MASISSKIKLYCCEYDNIFEFSDKDILPARCEGCSHVLCAKVMRERVRNNIDKLQLEFDFAKEV